MRKILMGAMLALLLTQNVFAENLDTSNDYSDSNVDDIVETKTTPSKGFLPDISFILDSSYVYRDLSNETLGSLKTPSFTKDIGEFKKNGFNINYGELSLASTIDPYFDLLAVMPFTLEGVGIEEAFITSRFLPFGFQLKTGKFRSNFGRLNAQHEHTWDFSDSPFIYNSFFGAEQLNDTGLQLNWLSPLDTYLLFGAEILQGSNQTNFDTKAINIGKTTISENNLPNLVTGYVKTSFDFDNLTLLGGLSVAYGGTRKNDVSEDLKNNTSFDGNTKIYGADLTFKYFIDSYSYLALQSEFMYKNATLTKINDTDSIPFTQNQSGLYSQLVYKLNDTWRTALRYDLLAQNDTFEKNVKLDNPSNLSRYSAMLEYNTSEFARVRLQYNHDRSKFGDNLQPVNEVFLQLNMSIGAHGAHSF